MYLYIVGQGHPLRIQTDQLVVLRDFCENRKQRQLVCSIEPNVGAVLVVFCLRNVNCNAYDVTLLKAQDWERPFAFPNSFFEWIAEPMAVIMY